MTDPYLTTEELKARGWTLGMIRALLGTSDHERWTNRIGHRTAKSVKLYLATRVVQVERTEAFTHAKEHAETHRALMVKASQTRKVWEARILAQYEALSLPTVQVHPVEVETPAQQQELLRLHLQEFYVWQRLHEHLMFSLPQAKRREARRTMLERYQAAVFQAYGWLEKSNIP